MTLASSAAALQTFDRVWESAEENSQYVLAQQCFLLDSRPASGTPLNVLRIPYGVVLILVQLLNVCVSGKLDALVTELQSGLSFSTFIDNTSKRAINLDAKTNEFKGSEFKGRNTFVSWKTGTSAEELNKFVADFVSARQDSGAQTDKWRSKMTMRSMLTTQRGAPTPGLAARSARLLLACCSLASASALTSLTFEPPAWAVTSLIMSESAKQSAAIAELQNQLKSSGVIKQGLGPAVNLPPASLNA